MSSFTPGEIAYLRARPLARLATQQANGTLQVNPVGFRYDADTDRIVIGGYRMATTQKYRNVTANGRVALVIDDLVSQDPWRVRCLEIRGTAEALRNGDSPVPGGGDGAVIVIRPERVLMFGVGEPDGEPDPSARNNRDVAGSE
jgi:pyridoxamine 5'-phosphate oxidase family protein